MYDMKLLEYTTEATWNKSNLCKFKNIEPIVQRQNLSFPNYLTKTKILKQNGTNLEQFQTIVKMTVFSRKVAKLLKYLKNFIIEQSETSATYIFQRDAWEESGNLNCLFYRPIWNNFEYFQNQNGWWEGRWHIPLADFDQVLQWI